MILAPVAAVVLIISAPLADLGEAMPQALREKLKDAMVEAAIHGYWCAKIKMSLDDCVRNMRQALDNQDRKIP